MNIREMIKNARATIFSRDEATLWECVRPSVMLLLFGVLGVTYAVHMAYFPIHSLCLIYNNLTSTQILSSSLVFWAAAQMGTDLWNHHKQATVILVFFSPPNWLWSPPCWLPSWLHYPPSGLPDPPSWLQAWLWAPPSGKSYMNIISKCSQFFPNLGIFLSRD